jgi:hypothetical protein
VVFGPHRARNSAKPQLNFTPVYRELIRGLVETSGQ